MDKTVAKALRVFEYLCREEKPLGVRELARRLRLSKSNSHRTLQTLEDLHYVARTDDSRYYPTLKAWELGTLVIARLNVIKVAKPHLNELNLRTGESVYLATLDGTNVVYLDVLESRYPIRTNSPIGGTAPAHCSASGKVLLAYNSRIAAQLATKPLPKFTSRTVIQHARLLRVLENVRRIGYATNYSEWHEGVCGVAAPIHNGHQQGFAAIGISAPIDRTNSKSLKQLATLVTKVARQISRELGYRELPHK